MTTPSFIPQTAATLTDIRYYTPFDTYYYTTDNRPLEDIAANITEVSEGGGDSARRAVLLTQLALSEVMRSFVSDEMASTYGYFTGLTVSKPASSQITIAPGGLYQSQAINAGIATQIVKQGLKLSASTFSVPSPVAAGQSVNYLVQARIKDSTVNMPFFDSANSYLPCLLLNGELELGLLAGSAAASGSQTTPAPSSGWTALYSVTSTYGSTSPVLTMATNSPVTKRLKPSHGFAYPVASAATATDFSTASFPDSSSTSIIVPVPVGNLNPLFPVKVKIVYSAPGSAANVDISVNFYSFRADDSNTLSPTTLIPGLTLPVPGVANAVQSYEFLVPAPTSTFSGYSGTGYAVTALKSFFSISRNGAAGADSLAAAFYIHDVIVFQ